MNRKKKTRSTSEAFHGILRDLMDRVSAPAQILADILARKFREHGHELSRGQKARLLKACKRSLTEENFRHINDLSFRSIPDGLEISIDDRDLEIESEARQKALVKVASDIPKLASKMLVKDLHVQVGLAWTEHEALYEDMRAAVARDWSKPLAALALLLRVCKDAAFFLHPERDEDIAEDSEETEFRLLALGRLQGRACQVGSEVLTLLENGFADGAMARWRTLYELSVVAMFLADRDEETSRRYLDHSTIEAWRASEAYQKHAPKLGQKPLSEAELSEMESAVAKLAAEYGAPYRTQYGWAAKALSQKKPTFVDIEGAAGTGHLRPYYQLANDNVHAGSKGSERRLGLGLLEGGVLLGPSFKGMGEPGQNTALSLAHATLAFLGVRPNVDRTTYMNVVLRLERETSKQFWGAASRTEKAEARRKLRRKEKTKGA